MINDDTSLVIAVANTIIFVIKRDDQNNSLTLMRIKMKVISDFDNTKYS